MLIHQLSMAFMQSPLAQLVKCKALNLSSAFVLGNWIRPSPFSWCRTPFCAVSGLDLSSDLHLFPAAWTRFGAVSGLDSPKRGPAPHQLRPSPFSCCLDPFLCRERPGSSKTGPSTFTFFLVLGPVLEDPGRSLHKKGSKQQEKGEGLS